jgi:hypothetical protein
MELERAGDSREPVTFKYGKTDVHVAVFALSVRLFLCAQKLRQQNFRAADNRFRDYGAESFRFGYGVEVDETCAGTSVEISVGVIIVARIVLID